MLKLQDGQVLPEVNTGKQEIIILMSDLIARTAVMTPPVFPAT
jgi:hypothetical protein